MQAGIYELEHSQVLSLANEHIDCLMSVLHTLVSHELVIFCKVGK